MKYKPIQVLVGKVNRQKAFKGGVWLLAHSLAVQQKIKGAQGGQVLDIDV